MTLTGVPITAPAAPGSDEWARTMSASKVPSAVGVVGAFDSPIALWSVMTGRAPASTPDNDVLAYGRYLEPALLRFASDQLPDWDITPSRSYHHPTNPRFTAAPDGVATRGDETALIEAKTARDAWQWGTPGTAEIPPKYLVQCAWQMFVTGARRVFVPVDLAMRFVMFEVCWEDVETEFPALLGAVETFMWHVGQDTPPDWDGSDSTLQAVRCWHPDIEDTTHEVPTTTANALAAAIREKRAAEAREKELKSRLLADMGAARKATTPDGVTVATRQSRNGGTPSLITARGLTTAL